MENIKFEHHEDDEDVNVENLSPSKQIDRFQKRLEVYRHRQNDSKLRVDQTLNEFTEQQCNEIEVLKNKCMEVKPKRANKRGSRKPMDLDKDIQRHRQQFMPVISSGNSSSKFSVTIVHKLEFSSAHMNQLQQNRQFNTINNLQIKREPHQPQNFLLPPPAHSVQPFNLPPNQQQQQQLSINPAENEFEDLDFSGIANLLGQINQPLDPDLLNFDENLQQQMPFNGPTASNTSSSSSSSSFQHLQPAATTPAVDHQFYNAYTRGLYFNPNFMP